MEINVQGVFEVHLAVADRHRSAEFYRRVLNFELATEILRRDITFLWIGGSGKGMLGLWGPACPNPPVPRGRSHFALRVPLAEIELAPKYLASRDVTPLDFDGNPTAEPVVLAWMPAASVYFRDPDGHSLEFIAMLPDEPAPEGGVIKLSEWRSAHG